MGFADIPLVQTTKEANRSKLTMDTITYANTHIQPCMPIWHVLKQRLCWAVFTVAFPICDHNTGRQGLMETRKEEKKKVKKDGSKQTKQT